MKSFNKLIKKSVTVLINVVMPFDDRLVLNEHLIERKLAPKEMMLSALWTEILFIIGIIIIDFSETQQPNLTRIIYLLPSTMCLVLPVLFFYFTKQERIQIISLIFMLTSLMYFWFYATIATVGVNPNLFLAIIDLLKYHGIYLLIFLVLYRIVYYIEMSYGAIIDFFLKHAKRSSITGAGSFIFFYLILRNFSLSFFLILIWLVKIGYLMLMTVVVIEIRKGLRAMTIMEQSEPPEIREARERALLEEKERKRNMTKEEKREILKVKLDKWLFH